MRTIPVRAALQRAIDAVPFGGTLILPNGSYLLDDVSLRVVRPMTITGESMLGTTLWVPASVGLVDTIVFAPTGSLEGLLIREFSILPMGGTPGRNCLYFDVRVAPNAFSKVVIHHCYFRAKNGRAIYVDNQNLDHDAFFTSSILDNVLSGGIYLLGGGDSINIHRNIINIASSPAAGGINPGIQAKLISDSDPLGKGNSKLLSIAYNNIVATEGILIDAGEQTHILYNNMECNTAMSAVSTMSALIHIKGDATHIANGCTIRGNYVGVNHGAHHGILVEYARGASIHENTIMPSGGVWTNWPAEPATYAAGWYGIVTTSNSLYTDVGRNTFPYEAWNGNEGRVASLAGQATVFQPKNFATKTVSAAGTYYPAIQDAARWKWTINTSANFTIGYPTNSGSQRIGPLAGGFELTFWIFNNTAGALGTITWEAPYKLAGPFVNPGPGKKRSISFVYDSGTAEWLEVSRSLEDA